MRRAELMTALRASIVRNARRYGAGEHAEDVAQIVLADIYLHGKEVLADPANEGALMQRVRHRTLTALRSERRRRRWEGLAATESTEPDGTDEADDLAAANDWGMAEWG